MSRKFAPLIAAGLAVSALATPALAQRDPAYSAARAAGQVGEQPDGYLGAVGNQSPAIDAMVRDLNLKRKAAYTAKATSGGSTIEQFAFVTGCNLIAQTEAGEKYMTPAGQWATRGAGAPTRDSRCP